MKVEHIGSARTCMTPNRFPGYFSIATVVYLAAKTSKPPDIVSSLIMSWTMFLCVGGTLLQSSLYFGENVLS